MGIGEEIRARRLGGARISAQRIFTNRISETEAFAGKVDELRQLQAEHPDVTLDFSAARRNVLAFYGDGGIGKTSLSRELERRFLAVDQKNRQAVRIDFSEPAARDPELYVLHLRAGLAPLKEFPAFDTGLALYWARQNPGIALADFVAHQSSLGTAAQRQLFARELSDFTQGVLDNAGLVVGGASRAARFAWRQIQNSRVVRDLRKNCPFFEACATEQDTEQLRLHLPLLLAWDLMRIQAKRSTDIAIFLDTFEHVSGQRRSARLGDLEDSVVRSAFFLPTSMFVITSRRRLDWAADIRSPSLEFCGPAAWPGLTDGPASDQHRVGMLSAEDSADYLEHCLADDAGEPVIPAALRREVARLSEGMPLYLDVACNHYLALLGRGRTPDVSDFAGGLPQIVMRLMEDLDDPQSDLLRAAALLRVFDRRTLRVALPELRSSAVEHFLDRSFVLHREDDIFSIHELLQASVRLQDSFTANPWSAEEWAAVASRLVAYWSALFNDPDSALWQDRRTQALAFWQLVGLYSTLGTSIPELAYIIMQVQLRGVWATIDAGRDQPEALLTEPGRSLLTLLDGMMERQIGDLQRTIDLLAPFSNETTRPIENNLRRLALYYLGETYDLRGGGDAAATFHTLATGHDDRLAHEALIALAHSRSRDGDNVAALALARRFDPNVRDGELHYRLHELLGHIWWCAGTFDRAAHHFALTRQTAEEQDSPLLLALARRHLALAQCWSNPTLVLAEIDDIEQLNRDLGLPPGIAQCQMSRATALIGQAPLATIDELLRSASDTFTVGGYLDDAIGPIAIGVFAAAVDGDLERARARKAVLFQRAEGRRVRHWLAAADIWTLGADPHGRVTWPEGTEASVTAWTAPLLARRQ
ncbi:hypothetical protein [Frankia sp. AiPa1]|uniref:hypothetical protein n=1 Tax=Frankia sp. AiPa1 TaxID=573492 RepID=UPI00202AE131|nr:hypothetical protein [Frankia sp. AiPa1]MCL9759193.1 hypothetical protein [Frankia sp. AiPa1]